MHRSNESDSKLYEMQRGFYTVVRRGRALQKPMVSISTPTTLGQIEAESCERVCYGYLTSVRQGQFHGSPVDKTRE